MGSNRRFFIAAIAIVQVSSASEYSYVSSTLNFPVILSQVCIIVQYDK